MLIQLNAEVWMGILNWLLKYRREMAEKFAQFGDRDFSQITQTWLHEWTKNVMLDDLVINRENRDELAILNRNEFPRNITDFTSIEISYFDSGVLQCFHKIRRLLSNVNLNIECDQLSLEHTKTILRHLLPLINGIDALYFSFGDDISVILAFFKAESPTLFYGTHILEVCWPNPRDVQHCLRWLFKSKIDGPPKTLYFCGDSVEIVRQKICEKFLDPLLPPMCYFARIDYFLDTMVEPTTIQNLKGEQLVMENDEEEDTLLIARCPSDVDKEWLAQKFRVLVDYNFDEKKRRIVIDPADIGPIDEAICSGSGNGPGHLKRNPPRDRKAPTRFTPY